MMLAIPHVGISRSVNQHNVRTEVLCDWIEGSLLFGDEDELSVSDVVNVLCEWEIYTSQEFAWEMVENEWRQLARRQYWMGKGASLAVSEQRVRRLVSWRSRPAHSFCIALAYAEWYSEWARSFGADYTEQGELFERLVAESARKLLPGWQILPTGWSPNRTCTIRQIAEEVALCLGEAIGDVERWTEETAKELGLDLLCYRPFEDGRVGVPVYLMQCASGRNWREKLHEPDLKLWTKIVQFASVPKKAFSTPFALSDHDFVRACNLLDGMLLDRYRLLSPGRAEPKWESRKLGDAIIRWLEPRIGRLPRDDE